MKWPHRGPSGGSCRNFCDKPASPPFCWRPFACPAAPTCRDFVLIELYMLKSQTRLGRQPYRKLRQQPMPARALLSQSGTRSLPRLACPDRRSRLNRTSLHALHCNETRPVPAGHLSPNRLACNSTAKYPLLMTLSPLAPQASARPVCASLTRKGHPSQRLKLSGLHTSFNIG